MSENLSQGLILLICGGAVLIGTAALGFFLIAYSQRSRQLAQVSQRWPQAQGQIVRAEVEMSVSHDSDGRSIQRYYPMVEYAYTMGGQTYTSRRIAFGATNTYGRVAEAARELARYPLGQSVPVYYDPARPTEAVLERKAHGVATAWVAGVFCMLLGGCLGCGLLSGGLMSLPVTIPWP